MNWKERILHHQETPPEAAWDGIASFLDEAGARSVQEKIQQASVEAPPAIWEGISRELNAPNKQVRRIPVVGLRVAASITILMISALAIRFWLIQPAHNAPATTTAHLRTPEIRKPDTVPNSTPIQGISAAASDIKIRRLVSGKQVRLHADSIPNIPPMQFSPMMDGIGGITEPTITVQRIPLSEGATGNTYAVRERKDGYLQITGPDGSSIRISRKFESLFQPGSRETDPNKEEFIDRIIRDSKKWNDLFYKWRQEMMLQTYGTDPLNLLQTVETQEKPLP